MKKIIKTNRKDTKIRFKDSVASRLMLSEPRMVGFFLGNYVQLQHLFGEKILSKWDFLIHIEAVGRFKKTKDEDGNEITELNYKVIRGYWNPIMILAWFAAFFVPFFFFVASKDLWDMFNTPMLFILPAIPITLRVIVTLICSRVCEKANQGIKELENEINYLVERINKYPMMKVKEDKHGYKTDYSKR